MAQVITKPKISLKKEQVGNEKILRQLLLLGKKINSTRKTKKSIVDLIIEARR